MKELKFKIKPISLWNERSKGFNGKHLLELVKLRRCDRQRGIGFKMKMMT